MLFCPGDAEKTAVTLMMPTLLICIFMLSMIFFEKFSKIGPDVWNPEKFPFN
jgi:hypothetical protein